MRATTDVPVPHRSRRRAAAIVLALGVLAGAAAAAVPDGSAGDGEVVAKLINLEETGSF
jgi:hypothetical protein